MDVAIFLAGVLASFIGSYAALKVHMSYLRRDVDDLKNADKRIHERIDKLQKIAQ